MRISIIGPAYPFRGGIAHHVYYLTAELISRNHDVQVVNYRRLYPKWLFPGKTEVDASSLTLDPSASTLLDPFYPWTWLRPAGPIKEFGPDLVLLQWWSPFFGPVLGTLARLLKAYGLNSVMECHNVFPHEATVFDFPLSEFAFSAIETFITHSNKDRELLLENYWPKSVFVAPLPAPAFLSSGAAPQPRNGRQILFFGTIRKYKGLNILLEAMPKVLEQIDCKLLIAGEFYEPIEDYLAIIRRSGLEPYVNVRSHYVPNEEIDEIMNEADVLVMPYLSATQSGIIQMARRKALPVIATRTGGLAEAVVDGETGLICEPGDPRALADAIITYFRENHGPVMSRKMSQFSTASGPSELCLLLERLADKSHR